MSRGREPWAQYLKDEREWAWEWKREEEGERDRERLQEDSLWVNRELEGGSKGQRRPCRKSVWLPRKGSRVWTRDFNTIPMGHLGLVCWKHGEARFWFFHPVLCRSRPPQTQQSPWRAFLSNFVFSGFKLKLTLMQVFIPQKLANATKQGFPLPHETQSLNTYQHLRSHQRGSRHPSTGEFSANDLCKSGSDQDRGILFSSALNHQEAE